MGFRPSLPSPDCGWPLGTPVPPKKLHVGLAAASLGRGAKRKDCQLLEGLLQFRGEGRAYCGPVSSSPLQAFTSLWWQECGHHQEAGPPLPGLKTQGLSPEPPQSPAEATSGLELAWKHSPVFLILILPGPHVYSEIHGC